MSYYRTGDEIHKMYVISTTWLWFTNRSTRILPLPVTLTRCTRHGCSEKLSLTLERPKTSVLLQLWLKLLNVFNSWLNLVLRLMLIKTPLILTGKIRAFWDTVYSNETTRRYIPEGSNLHTRRRDNPKSQYWQGSEHMIALRIVQ
jgi:hypothetical protein